MNEDLIQSLKKQNQLLKLALWFSALILTTCLIVAAKSSRTRFTEIDVERINIVSKDGNRELVIANRDRLPGVVMGGKESPDHRHVPGLIFYNTVGDECGGLIWHGKFNDKGQPDSGMHFSMDRFGGDQQLALGHYEEDGFMSTGLRVYDRGLEKDYGHLWDAMQKAPEGLSKQALTKQWEEAGGQQTPRVFVGKTRGKSSALILSDAQGRARIMMYVTPEGQSVFDFLDDQGKVVQSLAPKAPSK